jgi:uncharacterized protein (TIGR01777 family)
MNILILGATGMVGRVVTQNMTRCGHDVTVVSRNPGKAVQMFGDTAAAISWDELTPEFFRSNSVDAVINLAGSPMIRKWTEVAKSDILESRKHGVRTLFLVLRRVSPHRRPRCVVVASSVAVYSSPGRSVDEEVQPETDLNFFPSRVWNEIEALVDELSISGIRTVIARMGVVIGPHDMLKALLITSRWYMGMTLGSGEQMVSWISHGDLARIFEWLIKDIGIEGPVNIASPNAVSSEQFSRDIAAAVNRPAWLRISDRTLQFLLGELSENFTASQVVRPGRLTKLGYEWLAPEFIDAVMSAKTTLGMDQQSNVTSPVKIQR